MKFCPVLHTLSLTSAYLNKDRAIHELGHFIQYECVDVKTQFVWLLESLELSKVRYFSMYPKVCGSNGSSEGIHVVSLAVGHPCEMTTELLQLIRHSCPGLTQIKLSNTLFSEKDVLQLVQTCSEIEKLHFNNTTQITDTTLHTVRCGDARPEPYNFFLKRLEKKSKTKKKFKK
jgi:hypothetical protein